MKKLFFICVDNTGYEASLEVKKIYEAIIDRQAETHNQIRIIDESGEDYLYPVTFFDPIKIPSKTKAKLELIPA